jgi:hypothetical protein
MKKLSRWKNILASSVSGWNVMPFQKYQDWITNRN